MKRPPAKILLVEWTGTDAMQLAARVRSRQMPTVASLATTAGWHEFPATAQETWPWPAHFERWQAEGTAVETIHWGRLPPEQQLNATEIDEAPVSFFPAPPDLEALRAALARLYSVHNATVETLANQTLVLVAARYEIVAELSTLYGSSPLLAPALLAAHRLLDLLLHDLRVNTGTPRAIVLCAPPQGGRAGFAMFAANEAVAADRLPRVPALSFFQAAVAQLAGIAPGTDGADIAFDLSANWVAPEIVAVHRWRSPLTLLPDAPLATRPAQPRDWTGLRASFPLTFWPADAALWVTETREKNVVGAAALSAQGGLTVDWLPALDARPERLEPLHAALGLAAERGLSDVSMTHLVSPGDGRHQTLIAHGFVVTQEQLVWRSEFPRALERLKAAPPPTHPFTLRPPRESDVALWRALEVARELVRPDVTFDADLSFVACRGEEPLGLLLAQRAPEYVWADVLCVTRSAVSGGCFPQILRQGVMAWAAAGYSKVVFATEGGPMAAFARGSGAEVIQRGVRLRKAQVTA